MVNGTLQWLIEEIYITNCLGAQKLNLRQLCLFLYVCLCMHSVYYVGVRERVLFAFSGFVQYLFFWYQVNDSHVSQLCASMHAAQDIHTLIHTHTRRDTCTLCLVLSLCMSPVQIPIRVKIRHVFVIDQIIPLSFSLTLTQPYTQHTQSQSLVCLPQLL